MDKVFCKELSVSGGHEIALKGNGRVDHVKWLMVSGDDLVSMKLPLLFDKC